MYSEYSECMEYMEYSECMEYSMECIGGSFRAFIYEHLRDRNKEERQNVRKSNRETLMKVPAHPKMVYST